MATFENSSVNVPPARCEVGKEQCYCYSGRPAGGGPVCIVYFMAGDDRPLAGPFDLRQQPGFEDFADVGLAAPFTSNIDGELKAFVSYKPTGPNGNDRTVKVLHTGVIPEVTR
jgi:hypothetical protein